MLARVPRQMFEKKPPHGSPCNRCGVCCYVVQCELSRHVFGDLGRGPCPALSPDGDDYKCGLACEGPLIKRQATAVLIGAGDGCDARFNGEPVNLAFNQRLAKLDQERAAEIRTARIVWGMSDK